jgi:hypothetical protein
MPAINPIVLNSLSDLQPALYWLDADPLEPDSHSSLTSEIETDLCIVGAGYTGLWTALLAKERDPKREVVIIDNVRLAMVPQDAMVAFVMALSLMVLLMVTPALLMRW